MEKTRILIALEWKKPKEESSEECIKMKSLLKEQGAEIIEIKDLKL